MKRETHLIVCRSSFCVKCWQAGRPRKNDRFIVFGGNSQEFKTRYAHQDGIGGFVPHLYIVTFPYQRNEEQNIYVTKTCLMHNCGIEIGELRKDGKFNLMFVEVKEHYLTEKSVEALLTRWKGWTGYTIL